MTVGLVALLFGPLVAFSSAAGFDAAPSVGGGGGYAFIGSPTSHGMGCAVCHQGGPGDRAAVTLYSWPPGLFEDGWAPGRAYRITVDLRDERRGLDRNGACAHGVAGCNRNSFVAEILTSDHVPAGLLCPDGDPLEGDACASSSGAETTLLDGGAIVGRSLSAPPDCGAAAAEGAESCVDVAAFEAAGYSRAEIDAYISGLVSGSRRWRFSWRAPAVGAEPVRVYLGAVDGDAGARLDPAFADYQGDAVAQLALELAPTERAMAPSGDGCRGGGGGGGDDGGAWLWIAVAGAAITLRRRGRAASAAVAACAACGALVAAPAPAAAAGETSCDIITGASCAWGEGCDCDADGYVRHHGEARKYCHLRRCPLDGDDDDPTVLGISSTYNADGDGYTRAYDCNDDDACIDGACDDICSDVADPAPLGDTSAATPDGATAADAAEQAEELARWLRAASDPNRPWSSPVNGGTVTHGEPPAPGCGGAGGDESPPWAAALALIVFGLLARGGVRRSGPRIVAAVLLVGAAVSGCSTTRPWQRGTLAKPEMTFEADALEAQLEQHMLQYREAAAGGFGGGGGGCGCN